MRFETPLVPGRLLRRYQRFLSDVVLNTGEAVTAACPNTGAMTGLIEPGGQVSLSRSDNPRRKYVHTWELVAVPGIGLVGVNTGHPNRIVAEAIGAGLVPALAGYAAMRREVPYGRSSRIDLLLEDSRLPPCYVEVKNTHLFRKPGLAEFPDCVTERGRKHLEELAAMTRQGARACMVYLVQAASPDRFALAGDLDPHYLQAFRRARKAGVEALALCCKVTPATIVADRLIPVLEE